MSTQGVEVQRGLFVGMHAMNGNRQGLTLKRRYDTEEEAQAEADKLNAMPERQEPWEHLDAYPCLFGDAKGTWGQGELHWHLGRNRALRKPS
jgi:hypothetical protein